ncbi:type I restriction enzyme HsdR N-terminal domain-containing protein [Fibrobacterota bacterium]
MKTRLHNDKKQLYDPVRKKWVAFTPEEHVRQSVLAFLATELGVPVSLTGVEYSLSHIEPGNRRQVDILVWKPGAPEDKVPIKPWLMVECKAPAVKITQDLQYQVSRYLSVAPSRYLMLTNGKTSLYFELVNGGYVTIQSLPAFKNT